MKDKLKRAWDYTTEHWFEWILWIAGCIMLGFFPIRMAFKMVFGD